MISITDAHRLLNEQKTEFKTEEKYLVESRGFYLAEKIKAPFDLPAFDNSAMDGYAVCGVHENYRLVGEIAAGDTATHSIQAGDAMRIFTGGKVPENTTAVVMQEKTEVTAKAVRLQGPVTAGQNIRRKGEELSKGQEAFAPGHFITPASIGLIGSLGIEKVKVYTKPEVRLITTGNELIVPGQPKKEGQIYESNSLALTLALEKFGFKCAEKRQIEDDYKKIKDGIKTCFDNSDVLLLSGGISVGDYDYVRQALIENDVQEIFYKIFQKPGKPLFFGRKDTKYVFALPGNPASALTCFYVYVLPFLQKLSGADKPGLMRIFVPLFHDFQLKGDRPTFLKANISNQQVSILDGQGSSMIHSMAIGNALVRMEGGSSLKAGDLVECILI